MIFRFRFLFLALLVSLFASCFKKDDSIVLQQPGNVEVDQVAMGPDYVNQIYYQLSTKETFMSDHRSWDLAFETSANGYHIWINGSNQIFVNNTNSSNFDNITDTVGSNWLMDASSWNKDSTAIGEWINSNPVVDPSVPKDDLFNSSPGRIEEMVTSTRVYLIDLGPDMLAAERYKKIVFESFDQLQYTCKYANLNNSDFHEITIQKETDYAYTYFSIRNGNQVVYPEPIKPKWDILFTRYRTILFSGGITLPYIVTGVLINPDGYSVAMDTSVSFNDMDYNYAKNLSYKSNRDAIGFDWKHFNYQSASATYVVDPTKIYVIKDKLGYYWKLHFIGFYNDQGVKGYPQFEFQRL